MDVTFRTPIFKSLDGLFLPPCGPDPPSLICIGRVVLAALGQTGDPNWHLGYWNLLTIPNFWFNCNSGSTAERTQGREEGREGRKAARPEPGQERKEGRKDGRAAARELRRGGERRDAKGGRQQGRNQGRSGRKAGRTAGRQHGSFGGAATGGTRKEEGSKAGTRGGRQHGRQGSTRAPEEAGARLRRLDQNSVYSFTHPSGQFTLLHSRIKPW